MARSRATWSAGGPPRPRTCSTGSTPSGIDLPDVFRVLEQEGVDKFKKSWQELVETVEKQMEAAEQ